MNVKKSIAFSALLLTILLVCCKTNQDVSKKTDSKTSEFKTGSYRLIVSFISKGAGFDSQKKNALVSFIENHPKKPKYNTVQWGKEGEVDFCFKLTEWSDKEQADFVNEVKTKMKGSDLVVILENTECKNVAR